MLGLLYLYLMFLFVIIGIEFLCVLKRENDLRIKLDFFGVFYCIIYLLIIGIIYIYVYRLLLKLINCMI